jgi:hypothetical protein
MTQGTGGIHDYLACKEVSSNLMIQGTGGIHDYLACHEVASDEKIPTDSTGCKAAVGACTRGKILRVDCGKRCRPWRRARGGSHIILRVDCGKECKWGGVHEGEATSY